jgi:hypothetical protein
LRLTGVFQARKSPAGAGLVRQGGSERPPPFRSIRGCAKRPFERKAVAWEAAAEAANTALLIHLGARFGLL